MSEPFFTIGHSNRTFEQFLTLLAPNGVTRVVDVRTVPRSRANPQYNKDSARMASPTSTSRRWAGFAGATSRARRPT